MPTPSTLEPVRDDAPSAQGRLPRWVEVLGAVAVTTIVSLEFGTELAQYPRLEVWVTVLDLLLVAGFCGWMVRRAWGGRADLVGWLIQTRVDVLLAGVALLAAVVEPRTAVIPIILRLGIDVGRRAIGEALGERAARFTHLRPARALALSFIGIIGASSVLLCLPAATADGEGASITDATFTATSAVSTTGLIVVDTGTYWTPFGLFVILVAIQIGALGIMVLASVFAVLVGGRVPGHQREELEEAGFGEVYDIATLEGLKRVAMSIILLTVVVEAAGTLLLFVLWAVDVMPLREEYGTWGRALWWCFFHAISAFCNAGFSLEPDSLMRWQDGYLVNLVIMALITLGGVGFPVLADMAPTRGGARKKRRHGWHIQTKVVVVTTLAMNAVGTLLILFFEYDRSLNGLDVDTKVLAAFFQSVSLRSAGFNTVDIALIGAPTVIIMAVWMFIGSGPGSTGGGVRVTTATVVVMAVRAMLRNRDDVELYGRTLRQTIVYRSISIVLVAGLLCATFLVLLSATQDSAFDKLTFEVVSAFGCAGLSMGSTADLDTIGKWLVTLLMYFGRVGPITLALAIGERMVPKGYRYPEGRMAVG